MSHFPEVLADRYRRFRFRYFAPNMDQFEELAAAGQRPEVMVVSCCDSRVDPETIFSAMPGELFVMRNVANLVPPYETTGKFHGVSAALEFATLNLRVKHIVVMGHSACGGVRASLEQESARQTDAQFISNWMSMLDEARERVLKVGERRPPAELRGALEQEGVKTSIANLRTFPFIQQLEARGRITLHGAYFDIANGTLSVLNQATGEYVPL
jgi:carbonic anhydrase